jgi:hypothetical protein
MRIAIIYFLALSVFSSSHRDMIYMMPTIQIPSTLTIAVISWSIETIEEKNRVIPDSAVPGLMVLPGSPWLDENIVLKSAKADRDQASIRYPIYFIE